MNNWIQMLRTIPGTIVSAAAEPINVHPFEGLLPNLALVTTFRHSWLDAWQKQGLTVFSLESVEENPGTTTRQLLQHPATIGFLKSLPQPVHVLLFKPAADLEQILRREGLTLLNAPAQSSRRLENKLNLPDLLTESGIQGIPGQTLTLKKNMNTDILFQNLGPRLILQTAKGFSGNRTFQVDSTPDFMTLADAFSGRRCRITRRTSGTTWTANACVTTEHAVVCTPPFLQLTCTIPAKDGLPETIGSRGNLFTAPPKSLARQTEQAMTQLSRALFQRGFKGIFGADFLWLEEEEKVLAVEINPRLVASMPVLTPMEINQGAMPLLAAHILVFSNLPVPGEPFMGPYPNGGQLIVREENVLQALQLQELTRPGLVSLNPQPHWTTTGYSPGKIPPEHALIWTPESRIDVSSEKLRVIFRSQKRPPWLPG